MKEKNKNSPWRLYMSGDVGEKGFYISANKTNYYGPFKNKKIAEFFNLIAFGNPRSYSVKEDVVNTIEKFNSIVDGEHPNNLIASNSKFALWWRSVFEIPFSPDLALKLAKETRAQGYDSFQKWILNGCQLDGRHVMNVTRQSNQIS